MSQTVIGVFSYTSEAQEAKQYLESHGYNSADIDIATYNGASNVTDSDDDNNDFGDRISNFFSNLFGSDEEETKSKYTEAGRKGTVVTVHARSTYDAQRAAEILDNYGAVDVNEWSGDNTTSGTTAGYAATSSTTNDVVADDTTTSYDTTDETRSASIPVIEEDLQVGKREVETGGVRLRSRIVERPVEESIRLRQEHVNIERTAVNRPATEADFNNFKEGTVEVTEHAEVPVVGKDARVVAEVSLDKEVTEKEETIRDTVRHTEVDTENLDSDDTVRNHNNSGYTGGSNI